MNTQQKIIPHPANPEQGYIVGGGEYHVNFSEDQIQEVADMREVGFGEKDIAQYVAELALNELNAQGAKQDLKEATRAREGLEEKVQQVEEKLKTKPTERRPITLRRKEREKQNKFEWDNISLDGVSFEPTVHRLSQGDSRTAVEWDPPTRRAAKRLGIAENDNLKISYQETKRGQEAIFEGMKVPDVERFKGRGLGLALFKYWRAGIEEQGIRFGGTNVIRKPSIAKTLMAAGLKPTWRSHETPLYGVLLPQDSEEPRAASVYIDGSQDEVMEAIKQSESANGKHTFYDVVTTQTAKEMLESRSFGEDWEEYCKNNKVPLNARWQNPSK